MQGKQMIEIYDQGSTDYDALMQRHWHVDRQPLIDAEFASLLDRGAGDRG